MCSVCRGVKRCVRGVLVPGRIVHRVGVFGGKSVPIVQYLAKRSASGEIAPESTLPKPCVSHVKSARPGCYSVIRMYEFMLERVTSMLGPLWNVHHRSEKRT